MKFLWNLNQNTNIFIQENSVDNVILAWGSLCLGLNVITTNRTFCESRCSQARRLLRRSRSNPSSWLRPASLCRNPTSSFCLCFSINACLISNCCFVRRWCVLRPRPVRPARISIGTGSERPDPVMDNGCLHIPEPDSYHSTVWCHYVNAVDFLPNPSRHAIAHPWGRVMKCRLYVKILIYVLPQLQQHVQQGVQFMRTMRTRDGGRKLIGGAEMVPLNPFQ